MIFSKGQTFKTVPRAPISRLKTSFARGRTILLILDVKEIVPGKFQIYYDYRFPDGTVDASSALSFSQPLTYFEMLLREGYITPMTPPSLSEVKIL